MQKWLRFTCFCSGKIAVESFASCKRIDILQLWVITLTSRWCASNVITSRVVFGFYNNNAMQALALFSSLKTRPSLSDEYIHGPLGGVRSNIIGFIPTKGMDCKFSGASWFVQSSNLKSARSAPRQLKQPF